MEQKRMTAAKTRIDDIISGSFVKQDGFTPNFAITKMGRRLSRVWIMGTVVHKFISEDNKFASITIDDASNTIRARIFKGVKLFNDVEKGDIVDVIGKIKQFKDEVYVIPEIVRKIEDPNEELLRELELKKEDERQKEKKKIVVEYQKQVADMDELKMILSERFNITADETEAMLSSAPDETEEKEDETKQKILELIEKLDKGDGCEYSELIAIAGIQEDILDAVINDLLTDGECFEPRPGKIKRL
ncbi:OB-fold nucleic acid binding domain-containing protein [Candidatus Aenigmatarchaeota archaeon]